MGTGICLDTTLLVDLLRGEREATRYVTEHEGRLCTTAISVFELSFGAHRSQRRSKNLRRLHELLENLPVLPLSTEAAALAGQLYARLLSEGTPVDMRDLFIAAIAMITDTALKTANTSHFSRIEGLTLA